MLELGSVLKLTQDTFNLYTKAKKYFDDKKFQKSFELFGKVIFNLYNIKKNLNSNKIDDKIKESLNEKVEEALRKSSEYIKELEFIDKDVSSDEDSDIISSNYSQENNKDILTFSMEGDIIQVSDLVDKVNLNITNLLGETPLHLSVKNGDTRMTELLLKNGAEINNVTDYGLTVMEIACVNKDFKMIALLQDYGCRLDKLINLRDNQNNTPGKLKSNKIDLILTVKKLLSNIHPLKISKTDSFFQIKESIINCSLSDKKKILILGILDNIEKSNKQIGWNDIQEDDIVHIIWNAIHSKHFINSKNDIINCLIEELYYCKNINEKDNICCPSTAYERIIYSLAGFNPELIDINLNCIINYELVLYTMKFKEKLLNAKDESFVNTYNSAYYTEDQENQMVEFDKEFKKLLIYNLEDIYVKTGIMKKKELNMNLNKWINSV